MLINVKLPPNAQAFFLLIIDISSFDVIPVDSINQAIFDFDDYPGLPFTDNFNDAGYSSTNLIMNLDSLFYMLLLVCFKVILAHTLNMFDCKNKR